MNTVLGWVVIIGFIIIGVTYCIMLSFFLQCFNDMFESLVDINEEWKNKIYKAQLKKKNKKRIDGAQNTKNLSVRKEDGKSYFNG